MSQWSRADGVQQCPWTILVLIAAYNEGKRSIPATARGGHLGHGIRATLSTETIT